MTLKKKYLSLNSNFIYTSFVCAILTLIIFGCTKKHPSLNEEKGVLINQETKSKIVFEESKDSFFTIVNDFPVIADTSVFIAELLKCFELVIHESTFQKENERISRYEKVEIHGSQHEYFLIEYDYGASSMATYPWRYQLLLTLEGKPLKVFHALRLDFVTIFPNQNPFILATTLTSRGNGRHEIYTITEDTLESIYDGDDYQTYDAHENTSVFQPYELDIAFRDKNRDGNNDIVFSGEKIMLGKYTEDSSWYDVENGIPFSVDNPADRIKIEYIFLYDEQTGHFTKDNRS